MPKDTRPSSDPSALSLFGPDPLPPPTLRRVVGNVASTGPCFCRVELDQADPGSADLPWRIEVTDPAFLDATAGPACRVVAWIDPETRIVCRAQVLRRHPSEPLYRQHPADGVTPWRFAAFEAECPGATPASLLLGELWRPLDILARCLKHGATLGYLDDGWYVLQVDDAAVARAHALDDLAAKVEGRLPPGRPLLTIRAKPALLAQVHRVQNRGESMSAFIVAALHREVAARKVEERALAWGTPEETAGRAGEGAHA